MSFEAGIQGSTEQDYRNVLRAINALPGTLGERIHGAGLAAAARVVRDHAKATAGSWTVPVVSARPFAHGDAARKYLPLSEQGVPQNSGSRGAGCRRRRGGETGLYHRVRAKARGRVSGLSRISDTAARGYGDAESAGNRRHSRDEKELCTDNT